MRAIVALMTLAATVAGCAGAHTAGGVRGTVASVDWPNGVVLLRDVRSGEPATYRDGRDLSGQQAETGAPATERWPVAGGPATTVQPPPEVTVQVPSATIVIEQRPARIIVQQAPPQVEMKPAPEPQVIMQAPPVGGEPRAAAAPSVRMHRPAPGRLAKQRPWCDGAYTFTAGTNFGKCEKAEGSDKATESGGAD